MPPQRRTGEGFAKWWKQRGRDDLTLVLWSGWNPIGFEVPLDEYDNYSDRLVSLLGRDPTVAEIAAELGQIRTETIGMPPDASRDEIAANALKWWHYWAVEGGDWNEGDND
jgi:hypothetical protein